ncbi:uncharacterized protein BXZ73DRAFT_89546 [Epithele typhae]|uniref:uncharacterized protein n=1 Tax=Epithele typhae TaxID=378194 RepID=UPI002008499A|nr:uncharacterized protein BXZ73DRAFT_89546 [Epithele typhae]KAH9935211.1 hypothetical protein BXZ73DRAFT_89546 [Epithele typhae]
MPKYKLVFFAPRADTQPILAHLFDRFPLHVGGVGAYARCAFVSPGTGQFLPTEGASPAIGAVGAPEFVDEHRVEVLVLGSTSADVRAVVRELKKVHPYEEVAYEIYRLEDF